MRELARAVAWLACRLVRSLGRKPPHSWVCVQQLAASPVIALCRSHARSKGRTRSTAVGGALASRTRPCAPADHEPLPEDTLPPVRGRWHRWGRGFERGTQSRQLRQCPWPASNISSKRACTILAAVRLAPEPDYHGMQLGAAPPASMAGAPSRAGLRGARRRCPGRTSQVGPRATLGRSPSRRGSGSWHQHLHKRYTRTLQIRRTPKSSGLTFVNNNYYI